MKIKELLDIANQGYPDGSLEFYYDDNGQLIHTTGDTLAEFIVTELIEVIGNDHINYNSNSQLYDAIILMETARDDIQGVINALKKAKKGGG